MTAVTELSNFNRARRLYLAKALADPKIKTRIAERGATVFPSLPSEFGKFIAAETEKWRKVIRAANIKAE